MRPLFLQTHLVSHARVRFVGGGFVLGFIRDWGEKRGKRVLDAGPFASCLCIAVVMRDSLLHIYLILPTRPTWCRTGCVKGALDCDWAATTINFDASQKRAVVATARLFHSKATKAPCSCRPRLFQGQLCTHSPAPILAQPATRSQNQQPQSWRLENGVRHVRCFCGCTVLFFCTHDETDGCRNR